MTAPSSNYIRVPGRATVKLAWEAQDVTDALKGPFDKIIIDRWLELDFTPLYNDPTNATAVLLPYNLQSGTAPGTRIFGTSDSAFTFTGLNGLAITLAAAAVVKMPSINLGADKPVYGPMQIIGVNKTGSDPTTATNFYSITAPGTPPSLPTIPSSATLARQKWTAAFGSDSGWSALSSYNGFTIDWETPLTWVRDNGQRIDALLTGARAMCKCMPSGNTVAQLFSEMPFAGTGAAQGQRQSATAHDLVITGAVAGVVTLKNASITEGNVIFANEALNQGEVGFITNILESGNAAVGPVTFTSF